MDYLSEWVRSGEEIIPYSSRPLERTFDQILQDTAAMEKEETCPPNLVPGATYYLINEVSTILGALNLRFRLNDYLLQFGGNIGYGIRPSARKRGYATKMLALSLEYAKENGLDRVLVTCDKSNISSAKTIIRNGGVLENEVLEDGELVQRYWINLI